MNIYIAGRFETRDRLIPYAQRLETLGHHITSSWLKASNDGDNRTQWQEYAVRDLLELENSDAIILDTFDVTPRGGREVEWGAFVFGKGRFGYIVGPKRNIFHELATKQFETWERCIEYFKGITA